MGESIRSFGLLRFYGGVLTLLFGFSATVEAQWEKKPYIEWSDKEAQKVLNESPWGKTQTFVENTVLTGSTRPNSGQNTFNSTFQVNFRIRLFSGKPIRQAFSRVLELQQKGNVGEAMAAQLKSFANGEFLEYIIVTVTCDSEQSGEPLYAAQTALEKRTTAELKSNTYLEVAGQRVYLQEFQAPKKDPFGARFIFPRLVGNEPFITSKTSEVRFVSELPRSVAPVGGTAPNPAQNTYRLNMIFKVSAMNFLGKLEY